MRSAVPVAIDEPFLAFLEGSAGDEALRGLLLTLVEARYGCRPLRNVASGWPALAMSARQE